MTFFDNRQARDEGWMIVSADPSGQTEPPRFEPYWYERQGPFNGVHEVWSFVTARARAGYAYHIMALLHIVEHSEIDASYMENYSYDLYLIVGAFRQIKMKNVFRRVIISNSYDALLVSDLINHEIARCRSNTGKLPEHYPQK